MSMPESLIPAPLAASFAQNLEKLVLATQQSTIATLAAAVLTARGKPTSINEVLAISHDLQMAMFPSPSAGIYKEWIKTKEQSLAKVYE